MDRIRIRPDRRGFSLGGAPWFFLADTAWSATTNPTDTEWETYLARRAAQGFTAIQVNLLPQWDRSPSRVAVEPFRVQTDGSYDFAHPNPDYLALVRQRLAAITSRGMIPAVVLLWCNYVPDTWASNRHPGNVIPREHLDAWLRLAIEAARDYSPVYLVSGDTDFRSDHSISYYAAGLRAVKAMDPDGLTTLHVRGNAHDVPESLLTMNELDFYSFQSGHGQSHWQLAADLAAAFRQKRPSRPIVNTEPCYEGHGISGGGSRFGSREVRQAAWQGIVGGACAGVTYGAHGIWCWHRSGLSFGSVDFSSMPFTWEEALAFPGARDYTAIPELVSEYDLWQLDPISLTDVPAGFVAARTASDAIVIYLPYAFDVPITDDLAPFSWQRVDLATRHLEPVDVVEMDGRPHLWKGGFNGDSLLIGRAA